MLVDKYGRVAGSINLTELAQMYAECDDDDLREHYRQVAAANGTDFDAPDEPEPDAEVEAEDDGSGAPPKSGAGSGRDVWAAYAESQGVEVTDDMTRDEIIDAVEEADDGNDSVP